MALSPEEGLVILTGKVPEQYESDVGLAVSYLNSDQASYADGKLRLMIRRRERQSPEQTLAAVQKFGERFFGLSGVRLVTC